MVIVTGGDASARNNKGVSGAGAGGYIYLLSPNPINQSLFFISGGVGATLAGDTTFDGGQGCVFTKILTNTVPKGGQASTVLVTITENEPAADFTIPAGPLTFTGSHIITYQVTIATAPCGPVTIAVNGPVVFPSQVTFDPATWNTPQTMTVTASMPGAFAATNVPHYVQSTCAPYAALAPKNLQFISATGTCSAFGSAPLAVSFTQSSNLAEATLDSMTYTVALLSAPSSSTIVQQASRNPAIGVISTPNSFTFTSANWNVPQTATVTAVNDLVKETTPHYGRVSLSILPVPSNLGTGQHGPFSCAASTVCTEPNSSYTLATAASISGTTIDVTSVAGFSVGDEILVHQTQGGTTPGAYEVIIEFILYFIFYFFILNIYIYTYSTLFEINSMHSLLESLPQLLH